MSGTTITNIEKLPIIDAWELVPDERGEFDYLDWKAIDEGRFTREFVRYQGELYDLNDLEYFVRKPDWMGDWDAYLAEGFYFGKVFQFLSGDDEDSVMVGVYYVS